MSRLSDLTRTAPTELDDDENFTTESCMTALAVLALERALTRATRSRLKQHPGVFIVSVPGPAWVSILPLAMQKMDRAPVIVKVSERKKSGGAYHRVGADELAYLQSGRSVMFVTHDPRELLHETVLATADLTITVPDLSPALLRRVIRRVTGGIARGVTPDLAALDLGTIVSSIRPRLSSSQCMQNLRRAAGRQNSRQEHTVPRLEQLPLTETVRKWTDQTLFELDAVKTGALSPDELSFVLLEGPPGTGKTLIANSLAATAGWTFVDTSIGAWFTSGDGALGGVAKNLKGFIDDVLAKAPAIGFLDELDALPDRATMDARGRDWWTPIITLFLTQIDRVRKSSRPVLLVGASNFYERLDSALVRPGRLQQRVSVMPPQTEAEALALLAYYAGKDLSAGDLARVARLAIGETPASVEGRIKQARALARSRQDSLALADLVAAMTPPETRSAQDVRTIAIHEIGHAVVAHRLDHLVHTVSIVPEGASGGNTLTRLPSIVPNRQQILDLATLTLGGRAADIVAGCGANAGADADLANATHLLLSAHITQGLGESLVSYADFPRTLPANVLQKVERELGDLLDRAIEIITSDLEIVLALAETLVVEKILTGEQIASALNSKPNKTTRAKDGQSDLGSGLAGAADEPMVRPKSTANPALSKVTPTDGGRNGQF